MYRKLHFENCKYSKYTLSLNYKDKIQLQNLSKINFMQNIWFLKDHMVKHIQVL